MNDEEGISDYDFLMESLSGEEETSTEGQESNTEDSSTIEEFDLESDEQKETVEESTEEVEDTEETYIAAPASMTKEEIEEFNKLSPSSKKFVARREYELRAENSKLHNQVKEFVSKISPVAEVLETYADEYLAKGISPGALLENAIRWDKFFNKNPIEAARQYLNSHNIDPIELVDGSRPQHQQMQQEPAYDPRIDHIYQKIEEQERAQQAQLVNSIASKVVEFRASKPLLKDEATAFEIETQMDPIVRAIKGQFPSMDNIEALERAYNAVVYGDPRFKSLAEQAEKRKNMVSQKERTNKVRSATRSISGGPAVGNSPVRYREDLSDADMFSLALDGQI